MKNTSSAGFSLVELALALLIAGLGVLTVFNLFPQGLDASRKSVDASEISVFGNWVMDCLQAESQVVTPTNQWTANFSNNGTNGHTQLSHSMGYVMTTQPLVRARGRTSDDVQVFIVSPQYSQTLLTDSGYSISAFTYTLDIGVIQAGALKYARLEVWAGNKLQAVKNSLDGSGPKLPSVLFYREFTPRYLQ